MNIIQRALELWINICGVDPNATKFNFSELNIHTLNKELKESLDLDDTNVTTLLLLESFSHNYFKEKAFTVHQMINTYSEVQAYLQMCHEFKEILSTEELQQEKESFKEWLTTALMHYHVTNQEVFDMATEDENLGFIRRDALRSMESLTHHQFSKGSQSSEPPKYVTKVHEFWNINSLIRTMTQSSTLSGISLNLIREPLGTSSYFAFGIKNGDKISILTDKPNFKHPKQQFMSRRPGREFSDRIGDNHFPYELLNLTHDARGDLFVKESNELTLYQDKLVPLKSINELEANEVIWITMMFSLIKDKFWDKGFEAKELSYTGEMVVNTDALTSKMELVSKSAYEPLDLPSLKNEDVTTNELEQDWDMAITRKNEWMEERYGHLVTDELLNIHGAPDNVPLLEGLNSLTHMNRETFNDAINDFFNRSKSSLKERELEALDPTTFGTKSELLKTQKWVARYNQAKVIQVFAEKEFDERKREIEDFYYEKVEENQSALLQAIAHGEFIAPNYKYKTESFGDYEETVPMNIMRLMNMENEYYSWGNYGCPKLCTVKDNEIFCLITGGKASIVAEFTPTSSEALALLCGCTVEELPDVLQYWNKANLYSGNYILNNIDPMEWVAENPWRESKFMVKVYLSKKAYNKLQKDAGVPANKFWLKEED